MNSNHLLKLFLSLMLHSSIHKLTSEGSKILKYNFDSETFYAPCMCYQYLVSFLKINSCLMVIFLPLENI